MNEEQHFHVIKKKMLFMVEVDDSAILYRISFSSKLALTTAVALLLNKKKTLLKTENVFLKLDYFVLPFP